VKQVEKVLPHKANKAECQEYLTMSTYREFEEQCLEKLSKLAIEVDSKPTLDELDALENMIVSKEELEVFL